jgi:hypothetical protein
VNDAAICRLNFKINTNKSKNAPRRLSGESPLALNATWLEPYIDKDTDTWNSYPDTTDHVASWELNHAGKVKEIDSKWFECPKGQLAQFLLHPASKRDFDYYWFELDYKDSEGGPHGIVLEMHT